MEKGKGETSKKMTEYEKKRLTRIAENKAKLEALGISNALLPPSSRKRSAKPDSDDDYKPNGDSEEEDEFLVENSSSLSRNTKKKSTSTRQINKDFTSDLNKAIALSLHEDTAGASRNHQEPAPFNNTKQELMMSKMQMTEDELVIYFYQFDEAGKGFITLRDLVKMASAHDFTWSDHELQDMIRCFDFDKDAKLSLDEFRKLVTRCRMLKQSSSSSDK